PYETVTLHANVPGSLTTWLTTQKFAIDASIMPIIDAYTAEGFDFIALRLQPNQGVQQMKPVRVISPGAVPQLPLRMVAAGTGANVTITLFVIGEGRWETQNFPNSLVDLKDLSWDFAANDSNYASLRQKILLTGDGRSWINAYSKKGALLSPITNPLTQSPVQYSVGAFSPITVGELFVDQALINGETQIESCRDVFTTYAQSNALVVDLCAPDGGGGGGGGTGGGGAGGGGAGGSGGGQSCGVPQLGQIDARDFACGPLDDIGVALTGMHPRDVWLTRLESSLPHAALKDDLLIQASQDQSEIENWLTATVPVNPPCEL